MNIKDLPDELVFNIVKDWEKRNISPELKSKFLMAYLEKEKISQRELARRWNIHHSTFHDWISMRQEKTKEYRSKNELEYLTSRLLFVLSQANNFSPKAMLLLNDLQREIERKIK
ncbi:MAG: hypothetical protein ACP5N3_04120 [Candidatus Nanoarchaeia archaeon]